MLSVVCILVGGDQSLQRIQPPPAWAIHSIGESLLWHCFANKKRSVNQRISELWVQNNLRMSDLHARLQVSSEHCLVQHNLSAKGLLASLHRLAFGSSTTQSWCNPAGCCFHHSEQSTSWEKFLPFGLMSSSQSGSFFLLLQLFAEAWFLWCSSVVFGCLVHFLSNFHQICPLQFGSWAAQVMLVSVSSQTLKSMAVWKNGRMCVILLQPSHICTHHNVCQNHHTMMQLSKQTRCCCGQPTFLSDEHFWRLLKTCTRAHRAQNQSIVLWANLGLCSVNKFRVLSPFLCKKIWLVEISVTCWLAPLFTRVLKNPHDEKKLNLTCIIAWNLKNLERTTCASHRCKWCHCAAVSFWSPKRAVNAQLQPLMLLLLSNQVSATDLKNSNVRVFQLSSNLQFVVVKDKCAPTAEWILLWVESLVRWDWPLQECMQSQCPSIRHQSCQNLVNSCDLAQFSAFWTLNCLIKLDPNLTQLSMSLCKSWRDLP